MDQHYIYNSNTTLIVAVVSLALIGYVIYTIWKAHKGSGMHLEETLAVMAVDRSDMVFMVATIVFVIAEGITAASLHPVGEQTVPIATNLRHVGLSVVNIIASMTLVRNVAIVFIKMKFKYLIWRILILFITGGLSFWIPFQTLGIIAASCNSLTEYELWYYYTFSYSNFIFNPLHVFTTYEDWQNLLEAFGKPATYNAFGSMPVILQGSVILIGAHMLIISLMGAYNMASPKRQRMLLESVRRELEEDEKGNKEEKKDDKSKKKDKNKDSGKEKGKKESIKNLVFLFNFIDYAKDKVDALADLGYKVLDGMNNDDKIHMQARVMSFVLEAEKLTKPGADKKAKKDLKRKVREFFTAAKDISDLDKRGLGLMLSAKN